MKKIDGEMKVDFEQFLMDTHAEGYIGTDDMMSDAFEDWVQDLNIDDWIEYGNLYVKKILTDSEGKGNWAA